MKLTCLTAIMTAALLQQAVAQTPVYDNQTAVLQMPTVMVGSEAGAFQDVRLEHYQDDLWRVAHLHEGVLVADIHRVDLQIVDSKPLQAFLRISGEFPSGCPKLGQMNVALTDNRFTVSVYYKNTIWLQNPELVACTTAMVPFSTTVVLPVFGLDSGAYEYMVNKKFAGSFVIPASNTLP